MAPSVATAMPKGSEKRAAAAAPSLMPAVPSPAMVSTTAGHPASSGRVGAANPQVHHTRAARTAATTTPRRTTGLARRPLNTPWCAAAPASPLSRGGSGAGDEFPGLLEFRAVGVRLPGDLDQLAVIGRRLRAVTDRLGGPRAAVEAAEAVRLLLHRQLEGGERFFRFAGVEEHEAEQLARRRQRPRRDRGLVGEILRVGGRRQQRETFGLLPHRVCLPRLRDAPLDIDLFGPVRVLELLFLVAQRGE